MKFSSYFTKVFLFAALFVSVVQNQAQCSRSGVFISDSSSTITTGGAIVQFGNTQNKQLLLTSDFSTTNNGPDLHIILCKTNTYNSATDRIVNGVFTKLTGASTFNIPSDIQLNDFSFVLVHCVLYNHRFGFAPLGGISGVDCETLSSDNFNKQKLTAYPNPTTDLINFATKEDLIVSVYNNLGQIVINNRKITTQDSAISFADLPNGIYFVETSNNALKKVTTKIIKL